LFLLAPSRKTLGPRNDLNWNLGPTFWAERLCLLRSSQPHANIARAELIGWLPGYLESSACLGDPKRASFPWNTLLGEAVSHIVYLLGLEKQEFYCAIIAVCFQGVPLKTASQTTCFLAWRWASLTSPGGNGLSFL